MVSLEKKQRTLLHINKMCALCCVHTNNFSKIKLLMAKKKVMLKLGVGGCKKKILTLTRVSKLLIDTEVLQATFRCEFKKKYYQYCYSDLSTPESKRSIVCP